MVVYPMFLDLGCGEGSVEIPINPDAILKVYPLVMHVAKAYTRESIKTFETMQYQQPSYQVKLLLYNFKNFIMKEICPKMYAD